MISFPNAKINLGLDIISKREDGYHNISSCFYPIPFTDILEFVPAQKFSFTASGIPIDGASNSNLVVKAFKLLQRDFSIENVAIHLHKIIPMGAGLGGGSADAAFMLKMLDAYFHLILGDEYLEVLALELGSDCPFFIKNEPVLAEGRGEEFSPVQLNLYGYFLVLVLPKVHVSTAQAYAGVKPSEPKLSIREVIKKPIQEWKGVLKNDFEASVFEAFPELAQLKQSLYDTGAIYASMSGSGSAIYGIFDDKTLAHSFQSAYDFKILEL